MKRNSYKVLVDGRPVGQGTLEQCADEARQEFCEQVGRSMVYTAIMQPDPPFRQSLFSVDGNIFAVELVRDRN